MSLTLRPHTPPAAFCCFQYSSWACVPGCPNGAKIPDRSVRTPSEIVLAVTPGPTLTPPSEPPPESEFLPQPAATSATAATPSATTRNDRCIEFLPAEPLYP